MIKEYIRYLKHNPKGYWFKRRWYGWGWVPVKWQGWAVVLAFVLILFLNGIYLSYKKLPSSSDLALFYAVILISVAILLKICLNKGEKPRWSWGK